MFHRHHWQEIKRYFNASRLTGKFSQNGLDDYEVSKLLNGFTVVELQCKDCGDITSRMLIGDAT